MGSAEKRTRKGDAGEEDVDIGEDIPIEDYPSVEIERDGTAVAAAAASSGSSSSGSSSSSSGSSSSGILLELLSKISLRLVLSLTTFCIGFDTHLQIQGQVEVHQVVILMQIVFSRHLWKLKKLNDRICGGLSLLFFLQVLGEVEAWV